MSRGVEASLRLNMPDARNLLSRLFLFIRFFWLSLSSFRCREVARYNSPLKYRRLDAEYKEVIAAVNLALLLQDIKCANGELTTWRK
jgi:hypothetical protein